MRVQKEISNGDYSAALHQLKRVSAEGTKTDFYLSFKATCYENLYKFDSAAIFYRLLYKRNNSMDVLKKIADMEEFDENKKGFLFAVDSINQNGKYEPITQNLYITEEGSKFIGLIVKARDEASGAVITFKLPSFKMKCLAASDLKLQTNKENGTDEYFFQGAYLIAFDGEFAPCNKDLPAAKCFMTVDKNFYKMKFMVLNYECRVNKETGEKRAVPSESPSWWNFTRLGSFDLHN
jgi:hypothetical protein